MDSILSNSNRFAPLFIGTQLKKRHINPTGTELMFTSSWLSIDAIIDAKDGSQIRIDGSNITIQAKPSIGQLF